MFRWLRLSLWTLPASAAILICSRSANADTFAFAPASVAMVALPAYLPMPPAVLVGTHGGGGGAIARAPHGAFIGAEAGFAAMLAAGADPTHGALAFGARGGYQWSNGLALEARFDDLGVQPMDGGGPLLFASGGVRYGLPFVVMPFAEVLFGAAFNGSHASPGAGIGAGVSFPVLRHLAIDLSGRDWIAGIDGDVRHIPAVEIGISVGY